MTAFSVDSKAMFVRLLLPISILAQTADAAFFKYIVGIQSQSGDPTACPPPVPTVTIRTGDAPITIESTVGTTCSPYPATPGIVCTGAGNVTFYVTELSNPGDLTIEMNPREVTPFTCTAGLPVGQAYTLGQLCPDGNNQMMTVLNCSPAASFAYTGLRPSALGSVICVTDCTTGVCTQDSFFEYVRTERLNNGCTWDAIVAPPSAPTVPAVPAPTYPPVPAPTYPPVPPPTYPPVPPPTYPPVPPPTYPPVPPPTYPPVPPPTYPPVPPPTYPPVSPPTFPPVSPPTYPPVPATTLPPVPAPTFPPTLPAVPAPTLPPVPAPVLPAPECRKYADTCMNDSDCCSDRCVFQECQKSPNEQGKEKMAPDRGGAAGAAGVGGKRKLYGNVRGATA